MLNATLPALSRPAAPAQKFSIGYSSRPAVPLAAQTAKSVAPSVQFSGKIGTAISAWFNAFANFIMFRSTAQIIQKEIDGLAKVQEGLDTELATARINEKQAKTRVQLLQTKADSALQEAAKYIKGMEAEQAKNNPALLKHMEGEARKHGESREKLLKDLKDAQTEATVATTHLKRLESSKSQLEKDLSEYKKALENTLSNAEKKARAKKLRESVENTKQYTKEGIKTNIVGQLMDKENREYELEVEKLNMALGADEKTAAEEAIAAQAEMVIQATEVAAGEDIISKLKRDLAAQQAQVQGGSSAPATPSTPASEDPIFGGGGK